MSRHDFRADATGDLLELVIDESLLGEHGVEHPGCNELASIRPDLDAFLCTTCGYGGRIHGAWVIELWHAEATYPGAA